MKKSEILINRKVVKIDSLSSNVELINYYILKYLVNSKEPIGSWVLKSMLEQENVFASTSTIGRILKELDSKKYTELIERKGRRITKKGTEYFNNLSEKIKSENLQKNILKATQPQNKQELIDLMNVRKMLECETARLAALRFNSEKISEIEYTVIMHETYSQESCDSSNHALNFHGFVAEASNIKFLSAALDLMINEELKWDSRFMKITREHADEYATHHRLIAEAIKKGDSIEAEKQMGIHMDAMISALKELAEDDI